MIKYALLSLDCSKISQKAKIVKDLQVFIELTDDEYMYETKIGALGCGGTYLCAMEYINCKPSESSDFESIIPDPTSKI